MSRRTKPNNYYYQRKQHGDNWVVKPEDEPSRNASSSSATSETDPSVSAEVPSKDKSFEKNPRNPKWMSRNRYRQAAKHRFLQKTQQIGLPKCENQDGSISEFGGGTEPDDPSAEEDSERVLKENYGEIRVGIEEIKDGSRSECGGGTEPDDPSAEEDSERVLKENYGEIRVGTEEIKDGSDLRRRLEELRLGVEEPELSEELLKINGQAQEDELLALDSIYGDNIFHLDRQNGLRCVQIHIHIDVPKELTVSVNLKASTISTQSGDSVPDFRYSFRVEHLPPITLSCLLPESYPSHLPPHFTMSVQWLKSSKISQLCHFLDSIWKEQPGQEVIYQWVEWLQSSSLSYLQFDQELQLSLYDVGVIEDRRAISGSSSPDIDIPLLRSYDKEHRYEFFIKNIQECCICIGEYPGSEFVRLPCQHFFCCKCMKTFSKMHVKEGTLSKLLCPSAKCGGAIPPGLLKQLLDEEGFEQWERLMLQKTLESMSDVCYCPRCETICIEDEDNHAQCPTCFFSFCTLCRDKRHIGVACMSPEMKLHILKERQNSSQLNGKQRHREQEMINELLSMKEIVRSAKQCPSCKMAITRSEGCNKMVCENCGQYFCYSCNKAIGGYDHFRDGQCELFPVETIQMWEERMNDRQVVGRFMAQQLDAHRPGHTCPICGQQNAKVGNNNHILCWACQNHYCYLCRKTLKRSSHHFGPKGCKQHTLE